MKLNDYLHLYLGAECIIGDLNWKPSDIPDSERAPYTDKNYGKPIQTKISYHVLEHYSHKLTPILRPLSDMTEEENKEASKRHFNFMEGQEYWQRDITMMAHMVSWYLSKHFDLFGLIESGLAIDKTKTLLNQ